MKNILEKLIILVVLIVASTASADLVGHWKFDEGIGTVAYDSSIYGNNGIFEGDPQWVVGHFDGALEFDGTGDWLDCGTHPSLDITGAVSITAWIKVSTPAIDQKVGGNQDGANGGYKMGLFGNRIEFEIRNSDNSDILNREVAGGTEIKVGVWYHVAGVYSLADGYIRTYVNGVLDRELLTTQLLGASPGSFKIGCEPFITGLCNFNGVIDDLHIYNHAIDEAEIKQLYSYSSESFVTPALRKLINELHKARSITEKQGPQKAIVFLEKKITEYELWKEENTREVEVCHEFLFSELHFLLAKAREAANAPTNDVAAAYKQSISQQSLGRNYVPALLWLFKNISASDYTDAIKKSMHNSSGAPDYLPRIAKDFESSKNWAAFKLFCDTIFSGFNDNTSYAKAIAKGLNKDGMWPNMFSEYCQSKPELIEYVFGEHEKQAQEYIEQDEFSKAVKIYRDLASQCVSDQDRSAYELKVSECIFESGEYDRFFSELNDFINNNKSVNEDLVMKAMLLKGQAYLQLDKIDKATNTFLELMINYPKTEQAVEANFFIGYCNILQGKFEEAKETFGFVVKDYPQSSYASKARLCLRRIERMEK